VFSVQSSEFSVRYSLPALTLTYQTGRAVRQGYSVFVIRCSVFSVQCSEFRVQSSVFGIRCSEFRVRCSLSALTLAYQTGRAVRQGCSEFSVQSSEFGDRCSVFGI